MNKLRVVQPQRRAKPANLLKTQANHRSRPRASWGRGRGSFSSYFSPERNTQTQTRLTALGLWQSLPGHGPKIKSFCFCFLHRQRSLVPERKTHKGTFKISPGMMLSKKQKTTDQILKACIRSNNRKHWKATSWMELRPLSARCVCARTKASPDDQTLKPCYLVLF